MSEFCEGPSPLIFSEDQDVTPLKEIRTDQQSLSFCLKQVLATKIDGLPARTETVSVVKKGPAGVLTGPEQKRLAEAALRGETTMPQFISTVEEEKKLLDKEISQLNTHFITVADSLILANRRMTKGLFREIHELFRILVQEKARTLLPNDITVTHSRIVFHVLAKHPNGVFLNTFETQNPNEAKEKYLEILGKTVFQSNQGDPNPHKVGTMAARLQIANQIFEERHKTSRDLVLSFDHHTYAGFSEDLDKVSPIIRGKLERGWVRWQTEAEKDF